jgi:hypothetical protein
LADNPEMSEIQFTASMEIEIQLRFAMRDRLIPKVREEYLKVGSFTSGYVLGVYQLTQRGRILLKDDLTQKKKFYSHFINDKVAES